MKKSNLNSSNQIILNERYIIKEELGNGTTSTVYKVQDMQTDEIKAAKIFDKNMKEDFEKEVEIYKQLTNNNINSNIKYFESGLGSFSSKQKNIQKRYIILEYAKYGSLFDAVFENKAGFNEDICKFFFNKMLNSVEEIHKKGICHRDLKLENMLLVDDNFDLKICDFGCSKNFFNKFNKKKLLKSRVGTTYFCAPEILEGKEYDGEKIDIFSIGSSLFVLMVGKFPFTDANINNKLYKYIKNKKYNTYWKHLEKQLNIKIISEKFKKLFVKLVAYDPKERPSIEEIKIDEWVQDIGNLNLEQLNFLRNKNKKEIN